MKRSQTRMAILATVLLAGASAQADSVKDKKARASVDTAFADSTAKVTDCSKKFKFVYDWKAFDAIDFAKGGRAKNDSVSSEVPNVTEFGEAINALCHDKDYKEALGKVTTIVYKPTGNDAITVKASVAAGTMTIENFILGSTRVAGDYEAAAKEAL